MPGVLDRANKFLQTKGQQKEGQVIDAINAPAFNKGIAGHIAAIPSAFGFSHIKYLMGVGSEAKNGRDGVDYFPSINFGDKKSFSHIDQDFVKAAFDLKKDIHSCLLQAALMSKEFGYPVSYKDTPYFQRNLGPKLKAYNLTDFANWIPTLNTRFYFEEYEVAPGIAKFFDEYPMNSKTERVNGYTSRLIAKRAVDTSTFDEQSETDSEFLLDAQDLVIHSKITEDLIQDANPKVFDSLRKAWMLALVRGLERAIIDGDDTNSGTGQGSGHMDSDVQSDLYDARTLFKGLRKKALDNSANGVVVDHGGTVVNKTTFDKLIAAAGKFATDIGDLVWVVSPSVRNKIITGGIPELLTIQNFGGNATLVTGELPPIYGIPAYCSEWVREDLAATGVYGAASTKTTVALVKKSRFMVGMRSPAKLWVTPSLANQDVLLGTGKMRIAFNGVPQSATEKSVLLSRNIERF